MSESVGAGRGDVPHEPAFPSVTRRGLSYDGRASELAGLAMTNGLLTLATLGIHRFWAKTRIRRYLWSRIAFDDDRLEYTGRGLELLLGFLFALAILFLFFGSFAALAALSLLGPGASSLIQALQGLGVLLLIPVALFRARRYRLSRTQWRGIRLGQTGSSWRYALLAVAWLSVAVLSFGLATNVYRTRLQAYRTKHTWFGDRRLEFRGSAGDLFAPWFVAWILMPFTFGLSYIWYRVREFRYFVASTRMGSLEFRSELRTGKILAIFLIFYLVTAAVFGLAAVAIGALVPTLWDAFSSMASGESGIGPEVLTPGHWLVLVTVIAVSVLMMVVRQVFLVHPMIAAVAGTSTVLGSEDFARIAQSQQTAPTRGEGLADALDVGAV